MRDENTRIAHIRGDGSVDTAFAPDLTGSIVSLAFAGPSLVVMGDVAAGSTRGLVVVDAATGQVQPWTPLLPGVNPRALDAVATDGVVYLLWDDAQSSHVTAFDGGNGLIAWTADLAGGVPAVPNYQGTFNLPGGDIAVAGSRLVVGLNRLFAIDRATGQVDPAWGAGQTGNAVVFALRVHGGVVYIGGAILSWAGQPRQGLAAVDLASGDLLPWAPLASRDVTALEVSAAGTVFVGGPGLGAHTIAGQPWSGIAAIDAAGQVTSWVAQPTFQRVITMAMSSTGTLIAGTSLVTTASVQRPGIAAFDAATGRLLPPVPLPLAVAGAPIDDLLAAGETLFIAFGGESPSVWALDWKSAGNATMMSAGGWPLRFGGADTQWVYVNIAGVGARRFGLTTRQLDPHWRANGFAVVSASPRVVAVRDGHPAVLDTLTGTAVSTFPAADETVVDGDTLYQLVQIGPNIQRKVTATDIRYGIPVTAPAVTGRLVTLTVADGRLFFGGSDITTPSGSRTGVVETDRNGVPTSWSGYAPHAGPLAPGIVGLVHPFGRQLAVVSSAGFWNTRVAMFDLRGATSPSALRSTDAGSSLEFTWDPGVRAAPGTFVLEAGYAAGATVAQVPVGSATTFTAPGPIPGTVFVRVRDAGTAEVSNEIVVGCLAPAPPTRLTADLTAAGVVLTWAPSSRTTTYTLAAGTASRGRDIGTLTVPVTQTSLTTPAPPGTYFLRVRANNACGTSPESGEVFFTVGSGVPTPDPPANLTVSVSGSAVSLWWLLQDPAYAAEYVLEVGSSAGQADLGQFRIPRVIGSRNGVPMATFAAQGVPPGTYYLRVRVVNAAGASAPSNEVIASVR